MKKFLLVLALFSGLAFAEASFEQIEGLIQQKNYQAAEQGLEVIIKNHPQSAKAFYAMAQAQAGLGNLDKAQKALNIATGLNPTLDFAPASSVASLKEAITPQAKKIEAIEETHTVRNTILIIFVLALGFVVYSVYRRNKEADEVAEKKLKEHEEAMEQVRARMKAEREADKKKSEGSGYASSYTRPAYQGAPATVNTTQPAPSTTVVNNTTSNSGSDMLTGVLIGNMLSNHHHDTERTVVRETVREVPAPSRDSSWDDTPAPSRSSSRSSSWDDSSSSSSKSSSWDDDSSSKSSSSWSSSSDSSSSSSWDSGSSSSSSDSSW